MERRLRRDLAADVMTHGHGHRNRARRRHHRRLPSGARYIELFYSRRRLHTANGYPPPYEVRVEYLKVQEAA